MVSVAAITTRFRRRDFRRNGAHLEHDNRGPIALVDDAVSNNVCSVVAAPERVPYDTWLPNKCGHDSQLSEYGKGD